MKFKIWRILYNLKGETMKIQSKKEDGRHHGDDIGYDVLSTRFKH